MAEVFAAAAQVAAAVSDIVVSEVLAGTSQISLRIYAVSRAEVLTSAVVVALGVYAVSGTEVFSGAVVVALGIASKAAAEVFAGSAHVSLPIGLVARAESVAGSLDLTRLIFFGSLSLSSWERNLSHMSLALLFLFALYALALGSRSAFLLHPRTPLDFGPLPLLPQFLVFNIFLPALFPVSANPFESFFELALIHRALGFILASLQLYGSQSEGRH